MQIWNTLPSFLSPLVVKFVLSDVLYFTFISTACHLLLYHGHSVPRDLSDFVIHFHVYSFELFNTICKLCHSVIHQLF